jgi:hypothetical protein
MGRSRAGLVQRLNMTRPLFFTLRKVSCGHDNPYGFKMSRNRGHSLYVRSDLDVQIASLVVLSRDSDKIERGCFRLFQALFFEPEGTPTALISLDTRSVTGLADRHEAKRIMKNGTFETIPNGHVPHHQFTMDRFLRNGRMAIPAASGAAVIGGIIGSALAPAIGAPIGALVGASLGGWLSVYSRNKPR